MSRTMTISSWPASNVTARWVSACSCRPGAHLGVHPGHPRRACRAGRRGRGPRRWPRGSPGPPWRCGRGPSACPVPGTRGWASRRPCGASSRRQVPDGRGARSCRQRCTRRHSDVGRRGRTPCAASASGCAAASATRTSTAWLAARCARRGGALELVHRDVDAGALVDVAEHLGEVGVVERLLLDQRRGQAVERGPVRGEDEAGPVVGVVDELAHLVVDQAGDLVGVGGLVPVVLAEEHLARLGARAAGGRGGRSCRRSVTMARAISVQRSMSSLAPVVGSPNTSSSAVRPPSSIVIVSTQLGPGLQVLVLGRAGPASTRAPGPGTRSTPCGSGRCPRARARPGCGRPRGRR